MCWCLVRYIRLKIGKLLSITSQKPLRRQHFPHLPRSGGLELLAPSKAMESKQTVHMNQGQGETSYALNSSYQNAEQNRMKPLIEEAIIELCSNTNTLSHGKMVIADLGCSSGPNALVLVSTAVKAIHNHCLCLQQAAPEVCVLLNDLPDNDFNTVVKSLVTLRQSNEPVVVTGITPGSFYERLFTSGSLHLVCSSCSLHWLSKSPEVLVKNHIAAYDIDENTRRERLPIVHEAYAQQFRKDFTRFLELRAKELAPSGQMVVSVIGRPSDEFFHIWEVIAHTLSIMASEGMIDKEKFNSFYVPMYGPSSEELRQIIQEDGSFSITEMRVHGPENDAVLTPSQLVNEMRAVFEPIIVQHFGDVMDEFARIGLRHFSLEGSLQNVLAKDTMVAVSLTKA
uniref:Uncharacterized protein n=1 Tax=Avena sativa TaxID=4498 RepID=A0ACD5WIZ0_AVESA